MWLLAVVLRISLGSKTKAARCGERSLFNLFNLSRKFCNHRRCDSCEHTVDQLGSAISNISLCRLSSPFNSLPSIVQLCQACQRADLLLFCLIHCNDSVYKESEEPPTHTMLIFTLRATAAESINANRTVACLFPRDAQGEDSRRRSVDLPPRDEKGSDCV